MKIFASQQLADTLSPYVKNTLEEALSQWLLWSTTSPKLLQVLKGGFTNHSFLLECAGRFLVLRINAENTQALDIDRACEMSIVQLASQQSIAPQVIYTDPSERYWLVEYIEGDTLAASDLNSELSILSLAQLLKSTHRLPAIKNVIDWRQKIQTYWSSINIDNVLFQPLINIDTTLQSLVNQLMAYQTPVCICHHDVIPANIIKTADNRFKLVDWEYAAMGNPYFDLVSIIETGKLSPKQCAQLLSEYFEREPTVEQYQQLNSWKIIYYYILLLWQAVQLSKDVAVVSEGDFQARQRYLIKLINDTNQTN